MATGSNKEDTLKAFFEAVAGAKWDKVESLTSSDFSLLSPIPMPIGLSTWLMFQRIINQAMPDLALEISNLEGKEERLEFTLKVSGTHTEEVQLPMAPQKMAPTNYKVDVPIEGLSAGFKEGKISDLKINNLPSIPGAEGGIPPLASLMGMLNIFGTQK